MKTSMYKGIVVKVTAEAIVLLCEGGQFKNVPREENEIPKIGQTYTYIEKQNRGFTHFTKYLTLASGLFIAIFAYLLLTLMKPEEAYMFAVDINPSIEIFTDEQLNVVDIHYLNEDGKIVTNAIQYENESIHAVIEKIIDISVKKKYLATDKEGMVSLTVIPLKKERPLNNNDIRSSVEKALKLNAISANVSINNGSKKLLEEAHKKNLSINKYQLYKELKKNNIHLNLNELKEKSIRVILNETKYLIQNTQVKEEKKSSNDIIDVASKETEDEHIKEKQAQRQESPEVTNSEKKKPNEPLQKDNKKTENSKINEFSDDKNDDDKEKQKELEKQKKEQEKEEREKQEELEKQRKEQEKAEKEKEKEERKKQEELEKQKKEQEKAEKEREKEERKKQEELEKQKKEQEKAEKEREKEEREKQEELEKQEKEDREQHDDDDDDDDDD